MAPSISSRHFHIQRPGKVAAGGTRLVLGVRAAQAAAAMHVLNPSCAWVGPSTRPRGRVECQHWGEGPFGDRAEGGGVLQLPPLNQHLVQPRGRRGPGKAGVPGCVQALSAGLAAAPDPSCPPGTLGPAGPWRHGKHLPACSAGRKGLALLRVSEVLFRKGPALTLALVLALLPPLGAGWPQPPGSGPEQGPVGLKV